MKTTKVTIVLELELAKVADQLPDDAIDTWAWSLERQVEELELVEKATVMDFTREGAPA